MMEERLPDFEELLECMFEEYLDFDKKGRLDTWEEIDKYVQRKANILRNRIAKEIEDCKDLNEAIEMLKC